MIQAPFNSSCVALQYETGTKFFHRAVPELHGIKKQKISVQPRGIFHIFSKVDRVCPRTNRKGQEKEYYLCIYCQASREEASSSRWKDSFSIVK